MKHPSEYMLGDRLTPPSDDRKHIFKKMPPPAEVHKQGWREENRRLVQEMTENLTIVPDYDIPTHQAQADRTGLRPDSKNWPKPRGGRTIHVKGDRPTAICDQAGNVAAWVVPNFARPASMANFIDATVRCMKYDLAPKKKAKTNQDLDPAEVGKEEDAPDEEAAPSSLAPAGQHVSKRHQHDVVHTDRPFYGVKHYARAWHARGQEYCKSIEPSRDLMANGSNLELSRRWSMLDAMGALDFRICDLLSVGNPDFHHLLCSAQGELEDYLAVDSCAKFWHNLFFGRAVTANQETGMHLDSKGVRRGMDVLIAGGYFTGGQLYLVDMNVEIEFLPGTLIAFDGTAQRHLIRKFEGDLRFSHVYFVHDSVFKELKINTSLPDLTVSRMRQGWEATKPRGPSKRKKSLKSKGASSAKAPRLQ
ncbi:hypothetical protein FRC09_000268 [Ceratobasidium sp. 395]|nr:hypothetical protein FRC09_000268 [Ceratobasidium sp. 395]